MTANDFRHRTANKEGINKNPLSSWRAAPVFPGHLPRYTGCNACRRLTQRPWDAGAIDRQLQRGGVRPAAIEAHPDTLNMKANVLRSNGFLVATAGRLAQALGLCEHEGFDILPSCWVTWNCQSAGVAPGGRGVVQDQGQRGDRLCSRGGHTEQPHRRLCGASHKTDGTRRHRSPREHPCDTACRRCHANSFRCRGGVSRVSSNPS